MDREGNLNFLSLARIVCCTQCEDKIFAMSILNEAIVSAANEIPLFVEPRRSADVARLNLARLRIEDGIKLETVFQQVTETSADILKVERSSVWLLIDHRRALRCIDLFEQSKQTHSAGVTLHVEDFPDYFAAVQRRKTVPAESAGTDPRTSELNDAYLQPLGITSLLDAPIYIGGEVVGVVCQEHIGPPREWSTEERDFAGSMADIVALKIRAAENNEAQIALHTQTGQLAELRRMESLADLAAGVAHDFGNILAVINNWAALLAKDGAFTPPVVEAAQHIAEAVQRGSVLARELIEFSRPTRHSVRVIRPAEVVASQLPLFQAATGDRHTLHLDILSRDGRVLMAAEQLERVILNLVINARDAMAEPGTITLAVDAVNDRYEDGTPGRFVVVTVSDQGEGIPNAVLPRIFDPFFTTKPRGLGTGLGLAVVNQLVEHAGGFVRVETVVAQGTTFAIYLPRVST